MFSNCKVCLVLNVCFWFLFCLIIVILWSFFVHSLHCFLVSLLVLLSAFLLWYVGVFQCVVIVLCSHIYTLLYRCLSMLPTILYCSLVLPNYFLLVFINTSLLCFVVVCQLLLVVLCWCLLTPLGYALLVFVNTS
jgi:hypothetical protein